MNSSLMIHLPVDVVFHFLRFYFAILDLKYCKTQIKDLMDSENVLSAIVEKHIILTDDCNKGNSIILVKSLNFLVYLATEL